MEQPQLEKLEQVSDGWIKKYVMTFRLPNGSTKIYESVSGKDFDTYRTELERNAELSDNALSWGADADAGGANAQAAARDAVGAADEQAANAGAPTSGEPDGVCIVARTPRDSLVMIREFRYPLNSWCVSFPAGLVESGENFIASVDRELREETGYALLPESKPQPFPQPAYSSTGMGDETVQIVFAEAERVGEQHLEPAEFIEPFELPRADVGRFLRSNRLSISTRAQLMLYLLAQGFWL